MPVFAPLNTEEPLPLTPVVEHALVELCARVLPVWARQLASSRCHSEVAVNEMLSAFAEIGPHLDMTARQSKQITAALSQGQDGIAQLAQACEQELQPVLKQLDGEAVAAVQRVIAMVHAAVDGLEEISKPFEYETQMVNQQVDRMYKGFQYQDRISQMMDLLYSDIERLCIVMTPPGADVQSLACGPWLDRLQSQYVMSEQHQQHKGLDADHGNAQDGESMTFF